MEQHQVEYMKRNYPLDWQSRAMTSYDTKMAHMVNKIREKYKQVYESRPHTILVEHRALVQQAVPPEVQPDKKENKIQPVVEAICNAITITTNKVCGRKAKFNGFCGLHCKKV